MSTEANKVIVRRYIEEIWNQKNYTASDQFIAPGCTLNGNPLGGPDGANRWAREWHTIFPDQQKTIEDMIAEGDKVVALFTERGTQRSELFGIPPTGKYVAWPVMAIFRLLDGKIVDLKAVADMRSLHEQLSAAITAE
jgi:steroid delta-isomerase-like uncharacterized protein